MKNNNTNDYMFLTAKELAKLLLYGNKKLYNFTFDKEQKYFVDSTHQVGMA